MKYSAVVVNVVDGDTVDVKVDPIVIEFFDTTVVVKEDKPLRLRLLGIDTPEKFGETKKQGLKAKDYTRERLLNKNVEFETNGKDVFDRWLSVVYIDGIDFNEELLKLGYAVPYIKN